MNRSLSRPPRRTAFPYHSLMLTVRSELPGTVPAVGARLRVAPSSTVAPPSAMAEPCTVAPFMAKHSTVALSTVDGGGTARRTGLPDRVG